VLDGARAMWGDGLEASPANIHTAAAGMASQWFRNTEAVEHLSHAAGPWRDRDMLRHNACVTELCRQALADITSDLDASTTPRLETLLGAIVDELPSARAKQALQRDKANAPILAAEWISANGIGNYLAFLATSCPVHWWGAPQYASVVDQYCSLDLPPPEPGFRGQMLAAPWALTDEQADFVCDHRYDVRST
jgi:hypothetical protein